MNKLQQLFEFVAFMIQSTNQHGIHSPYLFEFYNQVISDDRRFYVFETLESIRHAYLHNDHDIEIVELGAGSSYSNARVKKISDVAKQQLSGAYQLRTIFRTVDWLQHRIEKPSLQIVELGASLGLSSFYLASVSNKNKVTSFEGNPHFVEFIEFQKKQWKLSNLDIIEGNFDTTFRAFAQESKSPIDLAFIDGNHREKATYQYFEWCLPMVHNDSILIFDDIHWSSGMYKAWKNIQKHPAVTASMDLYFMGIVFFRKDFQEERHLKIRPASLSF